jgi:hypothetical protein
LIGRLLLANALELLVGVGVASALGAPLGTSYLLGLAVVGIVSAHLALVNVPIGWPGLAILAAIALPFALRARPRLRPAPTSVAGSALLVVLAVHAWPAFVSRPLVDYDSWAIWGMKGKALALFGWADPSLFANPAASSAHIDYPILVPSLEAVAARAMGGYDVRTIHLQFLLLGAAGLMALHALLRERTAWWLLWPGLLALAAAPAFTGQLVTAYADVPVALFVAAGLLAAAGWVEPGGWRALALASLFFAAAGLTKNEGLIFAVAAFFGLLLATGRGRPLLAAVVCVELLLLPWQVFLAVHRISSETLLSLHSLEIRHPGIGPLAVHGLLDRALSLQAWPLLLPLFFAGVLAAAGTRLAVFAWAWALVSVLGLAWIYVVSKTEWSNYFAFSGDRVVDSLVVGAAALAPLLASEGATRIAPR